MTFYLPPRNCTAKNGVVIATEKKLAELIDPSSIQKINNLTPQVGVVYAGLGADSRLLVRKGRKQAQVYLRQYGVRVSRDAERTRSVGVGWLTLACEHRSRFRCSSWCASKRPSCKSSHSPGA